MATSVTSYVDVTDDRNAPSPKYFTAPNTLQALTTTVSGTYSTVQMQVTYNNGYNGTVNLVPYTIFNLPVKMSDSEDSARGMFSGMGYCNIPWSNGVLDRYANNHVNRLTASLGVRCPAYNSEVIIGNNVTDCAYMFSNCGVYNRPITIPDKVTNCAGMFMNCLEMDSPVIIGKNVTDCSQMFSRCRNFKQNIQIPNNVTNCYRMFEECDLSNCNIPIPKNATNCEQMFQGHFSVQYSEYTKYTNYNPGNVFIPKTVTSCAWMFSNSYGRPGNIYFSGGGSDTLVVSGMLMNTNYQKRVNVYCSNLAKINGQGNTGSSLLGDLSVSYTSMINGYYNSQYNIYLYQNYSG